MFRLLGIALLIIAVPLTIYLGQQQQDIRQKASTGQATITLDKTTARPGDSVKVSWTLAQQVAPTVPPATATPIPTNTPVPPTATPIPPTATPVPPTPTPGLCTPTRPAVIRTSSLVAPGVIDVAITAGDNAGRSDNSLWYIRLDSLANVQVIVDGKYYTGATTIDFDDTKSKTIRLVQVIPGQAATLQYTIFDGCGSYGDTRGGGATAWGTIGNATVGIAPTSVPRGQGITMEWRYTNMAPLPSDYLEMFTSAGAHVATFYTSSCGPNIGASTPAFGSCPFNTSPVGPDTYTVKLFRGNTAVAQTTFVVSAGSQGFLRNKDNYNKYTYDLLHAFIKKAHAQSGVALTGAETFQLFLSQPANGDRIITPAAIGNKHYLNCAPSSTTVPANPVSTGFCDYQIPADVVAGSYFFRMFASDGTTEIGVSSPLTITTEKLITATANPCILTDQGTCTSTINWTTTNKSDVKVKIKEAPEALFAAAPSGSQAAPWITGAGVTFELYSGTTLLDSVYVAGIAQNKIVALKNPCILNTQGTCTTMVFWSTDNKPDVKVKVKENPEAVFAAAPSGAQAAPWVTSQGVTFELYTGTTLIDSIQVAGVAQNKIIGLPNPCTVNAQGTCTSTIFWSTENKTDATVKAQVGNDPEILFVQGPIAAQQAPWITTTGVTFKLYSGTTLLDSILVKGTGGASNTVVACTTDADCSGNSTNKKCWKSENYPGKCGGDVCTGATVYACDPNTPATCDTFGSACFVPSGWSPRTDLSPKITGVVFDDLNANGVLDASDTRLANKEITLSTPTTIAEIGPVVMKTKTNAAGEYSLAGGIVGGKIYRVAHGVPSGYMRTTDDSQPFTMPATGDSANHNFGITKLTHKNGIISYWSMDTDTSTTVIDSLGKNNGEGYNDSSITTGKIGKARMFGTHEKEFVTIPNSASLAPEKFTVSAWVFPTNANSLARGTNASIFNRRTTDNKLGMTFEIEGDATSPAGQMHCDVQTATSGTRTKNAASKLLMPAVWNHVICSYDGTAVKIYINGALAGSSPLQGSMSNPERARTEIGVNIPSDTPRDIFKGKIDEVGYWNRALTDFEISYLAFGSSPLAEIAPTPTTTIGKFTVTANLTGIGQPSGTFRPLHPERNIIIELSDSNNTVIANRGGKIKYDPSSGNFVGTIDPDIMSCPEGLGCVQGQADIPDGNYIVKIKTPQFLRKQIPGIITVNKNTAMTLPSVKLIAGDVNLDNKVNVTDYNILLTCYSSKMTSEACKNLTVEGMKAVEMADINDDGTVDGIDYNLFIIGLATKEGD